MLRNIAMLRKFRFAVIVGTIVIAAHAAQENERFVTQELKQVTATVESVNNDTRTLVLVDPGGARTLVEAGPQVRNFDQVEAGDRVVASYYEALAAEVKPKGEGVEGVKQSRSTSRAPEGQRPAGVTANSIATTVRIQSVDTSFDTVTFKRPDGIVRTVAVEDPEAVEFISKLRPGDEVQITYTEAVAVSLQPTQR